VGEDRRGKEESPQTPPSGSAPHSARLVREEASEESLLRILDLAKELLTRNNSESSFSSGRMECAGAPIRPTNSGRRKKDFLANSSNKSWKNM